MPTSEPAPDSITRRAHAMRADAVAQALQVDPRSGLSSSTARARLEQYGPNHLREPEPRSLLSLWLAQFQSVIVALLSIAAALSFVWDRHVEGASILIVILVNALLGFVTEFRAVRSMEALRQLGDVNTTVRRDGKPRRISAREVVPGDVLLVEGGDRVTADARLVVASRLTADESTLTGESVPVDKQVAPTDAATPLAERSNMLFKGSSITRGVGEAVVVATGSQTELGITATLVQEVEDVETPLEQRLARLGRQLMGVSLGFAALIGLSGIWAGRDPFVIIETAIALAVATVPEGLPIVATMALARGMWRMARRHALIEKLSAVETLGSTSLLLTDKTGTLTENRMTVQRLVLDGREVLLDASELPPRSKEAARELLEVAALCNDASLESPSAKSTVPANSTLPDSPARSLGDPMEVGLLVAARKVGVHREPLIEQWPELRQDAFDPHLKMMATIHQMEHQVLYAVKGAHESVLAVATHVKTSTGRTPLDEATKARWQARASELAREGYRVLAVASKLADDARQPVYHDLTWLGLIALSDPPRAEVRTTIEECRSAGIRLVMVTGDQAATAENVARAVGLIDGTPRILPGSLLESEPPWSSEQRTRILHADVVARATPRGKLALLSAHQQAGHVVAMLGDGINDAPALRKADIGVAMGKRGTQVAREAADMVLLDDQLSTVVMAIEQGRIIFDNLRKFVVYLLSCNLSEILVIGLASVAQAPLPLLPLQILFLNLVTDVFPALALAGGEGAPHIMHRTPRPRGEAILSRRHWLALAGHGALLTALTLGNLALALGPLQFDEARAVTVSFLTLGFTQLIHVLNVADPTSHPWLNEVTKNRAMWLAFLVCTALLLLATYLPVLKNVLGCQNPGVTGWLLVLGATLFTPLAVYVTRRIQTVLVVPTPGRSRRP